jgi:uncharacterized DUF497 family protein
METEFEWDPGKADANQQKHGIDFGEAMSVFADPLLAIQSDHEHSHDEERFIALGMSDLHRLVVVVYTQRGNRVRIISARKPTRREVKSYES